MSEGRGWFCLLLLKSEVRLLKTKNNFKSSVLGESSRPRQIKTDILPIRHKEQKQHKKCKYLREPWRDTSALMQHRAKEGMENCYVCMFTRNGRIVRQLTAVFTHQLPHIGPASLVGIERLSVEAGVSG